MAGWPDYFLCKEIGSGLAGLLDNNYLHRGVN